MDSEEFDDVDELGEDASGCGGNNNGKVISSLHDTVLRAVSIHEIRGTPLNLVLKNNPF